MTEDSSPEPKADSDKGTDDEVPPSLRKHVDMLPSILEKFEEEHPDWKLEALFWIHRSLLPTLRHHIDDESEPRISWREPYVELHFPVECDWSGSDGDAECPPFVLSGRLSETDVQNPEAASNAVSELLVRHIEIIALKETTNGVGVAKNGDRYRAVFSEEDAALIESISDVNERQYVTDALLRPISFGAGTVDYSETEIGEALPTSVKDQIDSIMEPLVAIPMEADGVPIRVITIFEVQPLFFDLDKKEAYFPLVVGLAIQSNSESVIPDWMDQEFACFSRWEVNERDALWGHFESAIEECLVALAPESSPEIEEAIVSINAEIRIAAPSGVTPQVSGLISAAASQLGEFGEILKLEAKSTSIGVGAKKIRRLLTLSENVDLAVDSTEKGNTLELLMKELFGSIEGLQILENVRTGTEEIDLWIANHSDSPAFRSEKEVILVECKNWSKKCGKNEFVLFREKMANRRSRCSLGFLVSWNGFASTVTKEMLRSSHEEIMVVPIHGQAIRASITDNSILEMLREAKLKALKT